jgi:integrative and conjugative element protein (TIGR02256 family)
VNSVVPRSESIRGYRLPATAGLKVFIHEDALAFIEGESASSPHTETGGVIAGRGSLEMGEIHVTHASQPGPQARRTRLFFERDNVFCQQYLDEVARLTGGSVDYVGEWHKHQERVPHPSWRDTRTAAEIADNPDYHVNLCLLLIIGESNLRSSLRAFVVDAFGGVSKVKWKACDDQACIEAREMTVPSSFIMRTGAEDLMDSGGNHD